MHRSRSSKKTGRSVDVPTVDCCGLPQQSHGMIPLAKKMARHNIEVLQDYDLIITDCGSCGAMLKEYGELFADDFTMKEKARAFSQKVMGPLRISLRRRLRANAA